MNKHLIISLAVWGTVSMTALPAFAQNSTHHNGHTQNAHNMQHHDQGMNQRQTKQVDRIRQGVRSGELTRAEAKNLKQDHRDIRQEERQYKSDGHLSKAERRDLRQDRDALSKDIYRAKHDSDKRPHAH